MENRSDLVRMSEQLLRIAEVKHTIHPIVPPVTLPKKYVSLLKSPSITPEHNTSPLSKSTTAHQPISRRSFSAPEARRDSQLTRDTSQTAVTTGQKSAKTSEILPGSAYSDDGGCQLTDVHPPSSLSKFSKQLASAVSRSKSRSLKQHSSSESQVEKREQETRSKDVSKETKRRNSKKKDIQRTPSDSKTRSSQTSQKRDVMQFIQEQEQSLQERFLSLPQHVHKRQRPLTPTLQQSAGLDHLDNLVRLMEQLTALKDENNKLRKRCDYLESTRTLLQTKRDISSYDMNSSLGCMTPPSNNKYDHKREIVVDSNVQPYEIKLKKPRKSKSEEFELSEVTDSSSDEGLRQRKNSTLSRRFSTGSLAAQADRGIEVGEVTSKKRNKGHSRRMKSKQKSKSSKWSRVKQALTGQKPHDDGRAIARTFRDKKRSSHYPSSENEHSPYESRSAWYTVSESERDVLTSRRIPPNLKTTKPDQENDDPDLTTEIWMGPPDWWEEYESRREGSCTSTNSQASSTIEITTMYLGSSKDTTTSTIKSRPSGTSSTSQEKGLVSSSSLQPGQITSASSLTGATDEDTAAKEISTRGQKRATLHKSSSGKSADLDLAGNMEFQQTDKKSHRSAWGRVKDIIHTRKDSIKKKLKRDRPGIDHEETRDISTDAVSENYTGHGCGPAHVVNKQKTKVGSESPPKKSGVSPKSPQGITQGNVDISALLAGGVSEEFSKKMQEWEQLKSKKCSVTFRASADESDLGSLEFPQEFPVHTIDLRDFKGKVPDNTSEVVTTEECNTSMEVLGAPSESVDEKGRRKGGSFSRKLQVDRDEAKLEKERKKVERQRIRTLECEEKLEKLKDRLTQSETNGQRTENSNSTEGSSQSKQDDGKSKADEILKDNQAPTKDSPEDTTPLDETNSETSLEEDEATAAQNCLTKSNIASLERANTQLLENLHKKEIEYAAVQEEVRKVNEKLLTVREDHQAEMVRFYNDLAKGKFAGPVKLEVGELEATVDQLEEKIKMMENFGEKLASSMESAAIGKWQSIEAEDTVHKQLLELIEEMRNMLIQASQSKEHSEKTAALSNFETFYAQAMKLQVQMNNLRLSHLERNREIMVIKRQLLLQEVNNLLLQADITRKETELYQFQEAKIFGTAKKWSTFSAAERQRTQTRITSPVKTSTYLKAGTQKEVRPRQLETPLINIPYQSEEVTLAPPTSSPSTLPLPAETSDDSLTYLPATVDEPLHSSKEATCDQFTKRIEIVRDQLPCRSATRGSNRLETDLTQNPVVAPIAASEQTTVSSPQFSEFANQVLSKKCPSEQSCMNPNEIQNAPTYSLENSFKSDSQNGSENDTVDEKSLLKLTELNTKSASKINTQKQTGESGFTTVFDSVPLHNELVELRRVKREVEKEALPLKQKSSGVNNVTLTGLHSENSSTVTAFAHVAPGRLSLQKPKLIEASQPLDKHHPVSVQEYSQETQAIDTKQDEAEMADNKSQQTDKTACNLQSTRYTNSVSADLPPCSSNGRKVIPGQKESKEVQQMESCTASPRGDHVFMKGKPPLPRHISPVRYSTSVFPSMEKGPRSKSVGDVDRTAPESITSKPLQEILDKFGKRVSVFDTNDPQFGLRKLPSPTLHLPRVGLVSRVRNIKPAAELLALRQRRVCGHTFPGTKVLQKLGSTEDRAFERDNTKASSIEDHAKVGIIQTSSAKEDHTLVGDSLKSSFIEDHTKKGNNQTLSAKDHTKIGDNQSRGSTNDYTPEGDNQNSSFTQDGTHEGEKLKFSSKDEQALVEDTRKSNSTTEDTLEREEIQDKENVLGTNDERLSRDTALEQGLGSFEVSSDLLLSRTEQMYSQTECVKHNNTHLLSQALTDIVNSSPPANEPVCERQQTKLSDVLNGNTESRCPVENLCDSVHDKQDNISSTSDSTTQQHRQCDVVSPTCNPELHMYSSQPLIEDNGVKTQETVEMSTSHHVLPISTSADAKDQEMYYISRDLSNGAGTSRDSKINTKLHKDVALLSTSAPASPSPQHAEVIRRSKWQSERLPKEKISSLGSLPSPSPSKSRRSKRHNETIETLCKQSISAAISPALAETPFGTTSPISMTSTRTTQSAVEPDTSSNPDDTQLLPCNLETQASPPSPSPKEKVKSTRILDTKWLQKSKKFFKVSK